MPTPPPPPQSPASLLKSILTLGGMVPEEHAKQVLQRAAAMAFHRCGVEGCAAHSLGLVCNQCSRFACQSHIYLTPTVPPSPVCARCIAQEFVDAAGRLK